MKEKYYIVSMNHDGEWSFKEYTSLEDVISDYGLDDDLEDYEGDYHPAQDFKKSIGEYDAGGPGQVLIKGSIMLPKTKEIVTRWEFEET